MTTVIGSETQVTLECPKRNASARQVSRECPPRAGCRPKSHFYPQFKFYYVVSILCKDIQLSESVQSTGMAKNVM